MVFQLDVLAILIDVPCPSVSHGRVRVLLDPLPALMIQGLALEAVEQAPLVPALQPPLFDL